MSHPNPTGNGCTLEDCYTNLFVLTDICGIKWRRLIAENVGVDQLDDPVLVAYTKCLQNDILCVWRRVMRQSEQRLNPSDLLSYNKELWVFWYGDQPVFLNDLLSSDPCLREVEHGTWDRDKDSGLTYECRTLLFKALHNLIERCLLAKNFVRLGKWFVMPQDQATGDRSCQLSFCFHFFLHGESQVCASIEVKQHSPVWHLTPTHLHLLQDSQAHFQVMLAPFGMSGTLTGQTYRDTDPHVRLLLQQWSQYFPLDASSDDGKDLDPAHLPNFVEVVVAGYRMRYPSSYVLISDSDETMHGRLSSAAGAADSLGGRGGVGVGGGDFYHPLSPPHSPHLHGETGGGEKMGFGEGRQCRLPGISQVLGHHITERVAQDATLAGGSGPVPPAKSQDTGSEESSTVGQWTFSDPSAKVACSCAKHVKMKAALQTKSKSSSKKDKDCEREKTDKDKGGGGGERDEKKSSDRLERQLSRHGRGSVPFHRRQTQLQDDVLQFDMERVMSHLPPNPAFLPTGSTTIPPQGGGGGGSTPVPDVPMDTPTSAPSPLDPPPNLPSLEPTMPTLSPHPPSSKQQGGGGAGGCSSQTTTPSTTTTTTTLSSNNSNNNGAGGGGFGGEGGGGDKDVFLQCNNSVEQTTTTAAGAGGGGEGGGVAMTTPLLLAPNGSLNSELVVAKSDELTSSGLQGAATPPPQPKAAAAIAGGAAGSGAVASPDSQLPWSALESSKKELVTNWLQSQQRCAENVLKRPVLPDWDCVEDSDLVLSALYDRRPVHAWSHFPLKKSRYEVQAEWTSTTPASQGTSGLEPISPPLPHSLHSASHSHSPPDPYTFSDEASANPLTVAMPARPGRDRQSPRFGEELGDSGQEDIHHDMGPVDSLLLTTGKLMREKDLQVIGVETDLAQLFESSSSGEEDNDAQGMDLGFSHSRPLEELKCAGARTHNEPSEPPTIAVSELTRMYPTPPSLETHKHSPPDTATDTHVPMDVMIVEGPVVKAECPAPVRTGAIISLEDPTKFDVFVPAKNMSYVSAPKYSPLPASQLSSVPVTGEVPEYKPAEWQFGLPLMDSLHTPRANYLNVPSVEGLHCRPLPSPAFAQQQRTPRTPMSYELQSPASTPSSYLNKTLNSMDNTGTNSQLPEVHSLLVNILLSDSILNLFRDYNFDSCNVCVCNMDIRGSDMGLYLPDTGSSSESSYKCTCGFSAVINRRCAFHAGLFYEDEVDVTGYRDDRFECRKPPLLHHLLADGKGGGEEVGEEVPWEVLRLLLAQFATSFPSSCAASHLLALNVAASMSFTASLLDIMAIRDGNEAVYSTLDMARQAQDNNCYPHKLDDPGMRVTCLHKWPFIRGAHRLPANSQDIVQCLKSLQPLLQDAIQYKPITRLWEHTYKLQGPLSWKDFHQLSGRGSVESSAPQPIPHMLVTHDRDWLAVSPYSVRFWDKQYLEPFSRPRDILYVVIAPENEFLLQHVRSFFRELSTVYELCRLGRHMPIKALRDGIFHMGKSTAQKVADEPVDEWFSLLGDGPIAAKLKMYAQALRHLLGPLLVQQNLDRSGLDAGSTGHKAQFKTPEPAPSHPPTPECSQSPAPGTTPTSATPNGTHPTTDDTKDGSSTGGESGSCPQRPEATEAESCEDSSTLPAVVVYLIDPFTYGQDWSHLHRLAMLGLLRAYQQMVLPPHLHNNTFLQVVPLKTIVDHEDSSTKTQALKSLAFSVFASCPWNLAHTIAGRSLTGFGPAAAADFFLKSKPSESGSAWRLYSPPYILAPPLAPPTNMDSDMIDRSSVVFFTYCLSHDQRFLLCVSTDSGGELLDTCVINIDIPNRNRRKKAKARKHALSKLWDYILGIVSMGTRPTRIVIGRLGRLGHGELKGWSGLLGKKNLQAANRRMRETCAQCSYAPEAPCVHSACVVSMELNGGFQVMADTVKQEEKQSSSLPLQTPRDASVTHILVFPTSATAQVNANPLQPGDAHPMDTYDDPLYDIDDVFPDDDLGQELGNMGPGIDFMDFNFLDNDNFDPQPPSPNGALHDRTRQSCRANDLASMAGGAGVSDPQDDNNLLQQPLAMGYYVSTAPTGPLPHWLWSSCPDNQHVSPVCFKAALHVNMSSRQWQEDLDQSPNSPNRSNHPLDSTLTCDVLRFVLANYNALSWLTYDPVTNDRRSCLPLHKLVLMQMYHAVQTYL